MDAGRIVKFDPWLLGAVKKVMGELPSIPGDLAKVKSLTFYDGERVLAAPGTLLKGWMEAAPGDFSAIGRMPNLHTLLFRNRRLLKVGDFGFLSQCRKLKKLDLSGTDFSDCELLAGLPVLQYAMLPDRRLLVHTHVLDEIKARTESEQEKDERSRAEIYLESEKDVEKALSDRRGGKAEGKGTFEMEADRAGGSAASRDKNGISQREQSQSAGVYTADAGLIGWIAASLEKMPDKPGDLAKVRLLDSRKRNSAKGNPPSWLVEKEGDFSLLGKLPNLRALLLWGVSLEDFSFLTECRELRYLNLWDTNFTDCSLLVKLPFLRYVCVPPMELLVNFSMLKAAQTDREQEAKERMEGFLYRGEEGDAAEVEKSLTERGTLHISCESSLRSGAESARETDSLQAKGRAEAEQASRREEEETSEKKSGLAVETGADREWGERRSAEKMKSEVRQQSGEKKESGLAVKTGEKKESGLVPQNGREEALYREEDFADLTTVRGEDVMISWEGSCRIRHVRAEFRDSVPPLWQIFSRLEEEEDNWAKLDPWKAEQLTKELLEAVAEDNAATVSLSLEPWGEGHIFILESAGGWVDITYMDDETPVYYESYNPAYSDSAELSPIEFGGQTPIPKMLALEDLDLAVEIVRHILETGQLLPGTLWKTGGV